MPDAAINKQRIVAARRAVGYRARRRMRELIPGADHVIIEAEFRIQLTVGRAEERLGSLGLRGQFGARRVLHHSYIQIQLADDAENVVAMLLLHPLLCHMVGYRHVERLTLQAVKYRPHNPIFKGLWTDLGGQTLLNCLPGIVPVLSGVAHLPRGLQG